MRRATFLALSLLVALGSPAAAHADDRLEYLDLLTGEAVGELGTQTYDAHVGKQFVGTRPLAGVLLGGGVGLRPVFRFAHGVRLSLAAGATWGRLHDAGRGFDYATVTRGEFLAGVGWEVRLGRAVTLHTASLVGLDAMKTERAPRLVLLDQAAAAAPAEALSRVDLRLGQQVGAHLQIASYVALYADGSLDYDGQWRVRAGIAIGRPLR